MSSVIRGNVTVLLASAARTSSSNAQIQFDAKAVDSVQFLLNVTASSAPTTLDVYLQHSPNAGTTWYDFAHFAQVGAVATNIQSLTWCRRNSPTIAATQAVVVTGDAALAAGVVINGPIVDSYFRVRWVLAGTSYTFSLTAISDTD